MSRAQEGEHAFRQRGLGQGEGQLRAEASLPRQNLRAPERRSDQGGDGDGEVDPPGVLEPPEQSNM